MLKATSRISIALMLFLVLFSHSIDAQMTPGVQQSAAQTATITGTVTQSDGTPVAGADVRLTGPGAHLTVVSDVHGTFIFTSVPYGTYRIDALGTNLGIASREGIVVKGDMSVRIQYIASVSGLKEIARVSTSSAGAQINVTAASIASVNPSDYAFQGNTSWKELLDGIPGVTVGGDLVGGRNLGASIPDGPQQPIIISINGALPYETSSTLDGMPLVNQSLSGCCDAGSGTDISFLPLAAFETADVLRGPGANAPSIVDSIGGSFVLHAPGRVDKDHFTFSASNDPYGGIVTNAMAALRFGRFSMMAVYGVNDSPGPLGTRDVISAFSATPLTVNGQPFLSGGFLGFPANVNSTYLNCYCVYQDSLLYGVPFSTAWTQHNGAASLSYDVAPSITAQVFYAGSSSAMVQPGFKYPVNFIPDAGYAGSISPGTYEYINAVDHTETDQASSLVEEKVTAYIGHGVLRVAALQGNSFAQFTSSNEYPDGYYTIYGTGTYASSAPAIFNGTSAYLTFPPAATSLSSWVNNRDRLISYAIQVGSKSNVGVSYVTSYYNDPLLSYYNYGPGCIGSSNRPNAVSETTNEMRFNVNTDVSDKLSLDASWYVASGSYHVQDPSNPAGTTYADSLFRYSAPRVGAVWRATRDIVARIAAGGGFALPSLNQLIGTNFIFCTTTCIQSLTNLNLKPETSFGFDVGTDIRLHRNTVLSFDAYRTNLYGQFFNSTNLTGTVSGLPLYTQQYGNLAQSRYEGINVEIRHDMPKGVYWRGAIGLTRAYVVSVPPGFYDSSGPFGSGPNSVNTYIVPDINFDGEYQSTVPYANGSAEIGYRWSSDKYVELVPTYYGKNNPYFEPAFVEFDALAGYGLTKNISLIANFRNITGIYGQNYEVFIPSMGAPTVAGQPYPLFGVPYGPRSVVVTINFH